MRDHGTSWRVFLVALLVGLLPVGSAASPASAAPLAQSCNPRPPVDVAVVGVGPGRLQVSLTAGTSPGTPTNRLQALRISTTTGAVLDINDQAGVSGPLTIPLPGVQQVAFLVRETSPGAPGTVALEVVDQCGPWETVVGSGPAGFRTPIPTPTSTPTATPPVSCTPRPPVGVAVVPSGPGQVQVTIRANTAGAGLPNRLEALQIGAATGALLDLGEQRGLTGPMTVPLQGVAEVTFGVREAGPGQAATVPLEVVDRCGAWSTVVGSGPLGFRTPLLPPTSTPTPPLRQP